jgi:hypothetical protein
MSATVTEIRPAVANRDERGRLVAAERKAKREATEAKVREQAAKDSAETAKRNGAERLTSQARHALRREGLPCSFVPADRAESVAEAMNVAVATWDLDAAVAALRPYASAPLGFLAAVGGAASAHYAALMSDTRDEIKDRTEEATGTRGHTYTRPMKMTSARADAKRMVAEVARAVKPTRKAMAKRANSGPRKSADELTVAIAAWNAEVATFERDQGAGWRARRDAAQFGGHGPVAIPQPVETAPIVAPQPEPIKEETMNRSDGRTMARAAFPIAVEPMPCRAEPEPVETVVRPAPVSTPLTRTREHYAATMAAHAAPEPVETAPAPTIPQPLADYLARLVNGAKLTYVAALVAHLYTGADAPEMPAADWAPKALAKVEKYAGRKVGR